MLDEYRIDFDLIPSGNTSNDNTTQRDQNLHFYIVSQKGVLPVTGKGMVRPKLALCQLQKIHGFA